MTAIPTTCDHNAPGQPLIPGQPTICRKCAALIEPSPRGGNVPGQQNINAAYPGQTATEGAWALNS